MLVNRFFYPDESATSQLLSDLAFGLAAREVNVQIVASRQKHDNPRARLLSCEVIKGVSVWRAWSTRFGRRKLVGRAIDYATFYISVFLTLIRKVAPGDIVVAETDPPLVSVIVAIVTRLKGAILVNWCQDLFPEVASALDIAGIAGPVAKGLSELRNWSLRVASVNVALGNRMKGRLKALGIPDEQISVIPNWADGEVVRPIDREMNHLRRKWNLLGKFVVGYSGNFGRAHDFDTILNAAYELRGDLDIAFVLIGDGAKRRGVEELIRARRLENVLLQPFQAREDLGESLTLPDLHVVTLLPHLEGLVVPSKFYGVAAAGRSTLFIGHQDGEIAGLIRQHNCGASFPVGAVAEVVAFIRRLSRSPDLYAQYGENARMMFDAHFSRDIGLTAWFTLLSDTRPV